MHGQAVTNEFQRLDVQSLLFESGLEIGAVDLEVAKVRRFERHLPPTIEAVQIEAA